MIYKTVLNMDGSIANLIERVSDNAFIPFCEENTDYKEYLKWLELGNTPLPADE